MSNTTFFGYTVLKKIYLSSYIVARLRGELPEFTDEYCCSFLIPTTLPCDISQSLHCLSSVHPVKQNCCLQFQGTLCFSPPWSLPSPCRNTMSTPLPITDRRGNYWNTVFSPVLPSRQRRLSLQTPPELFHRAPPNSPSNSSLNS